MSASDSCFIAAFAIVNCDGASQPQFTTSPVCNTYFRFTFARLSTSHFVRLANLVLEAYIVSCWVSGRTAMPNALLSSVTGADGAAAMVNSITGARAPLTAIPTSARETEWRRRRAEPPARKLAASCALNARLTVPGLARTGPAIVPAVAVGDSLLVTRAAVQVVSTGATRIPPDFRAALFALVTVSTRRAAVMVSPACSSGAGKER